MPGSQIKCKTLLLVVAYIKLKRNSFQFLYPTDLIFMDLLI